MSPEPQRHFHEELAHLKQRLTALSAESEEAIGTAVEALLKRDKQLAESVSDSICRASRAISTISGSGTMFG